MLALVLNLLLPGVGTILLGQVSIGVLQLVLQVVAWVLDFTVILTPFGIVLGFSVWVWALVISIRAFSAGRRAA